MKKAIFLTTALFALMAAGCGGGGGGSSSAPSGSGTQVPQIISVTPNNVTANTTPTFMVTGNFPGPFDYGIEIFQGTDPQFFSPNIQQTSTTTFTESSGIAMSSGSYYAVLATVTTSNNTTTFTPVPGSAHIPITVN